MVTGGKPAGITNVYFSNTGVEQPMCHLDNLLALQ
jgi:hypothetical protein